MRRSLTLSSTSHYGGHVYALALSCRAFSSASCIVQKSKWSSPDSVPRRISRTRPEPFESSLTRKAPARGLNVSIEQDRNATVTIDTGRCGSVATVTIANPRKLNIVNSSILRQLVDKCEILAKQKDLRAVVVTGAATATGKFPAFIGGADIKEMHTLQSPPAARAFIDRIHAACQALRAIPVPVIARIDGFCLGAGLEIAAACDLRIATALSTFGMPEVQVGIPSVVEAALLPGLIGMGRTRRLLFLAENIDAIEAERWGLVEKVVHDEAALKDAVRDWTQRIVGMGPIAINAQKRLMQRWENYSVDEGIQAGAEAFAAAFADGGAEPRALMGRFVDRKRGA